MKLTLIGGGGVRAPLFVASCLARAERTGLSEIALLDNDERRLAAVGPVAEEVVRRSGSRVALVATSDPRVALRDASYVVTTIRVGGDEGRARDERIALDLGVLGQETTGPGGFAMAARTIPTALRYAELVAELAPDAWTFNFTNPAGMVTQALRTAGHHRVLGICDGANAAQSHVAEHLGLDVDSLEAEVFGLNHLSWCRAVRHRGTDVLQELLTDEGFRRETSLGLFDRQLVASKHLWLNEYLYYFYYADRALEEIRESALTRGEEVRALNSDLFARLADAASMNEAMDMYYGYQRDRIATYMPYQRSDPDAVSPHQAQARSMARDRIEEGYAGVALTVINAFATGQPIVTALNVPNNDAMPGLAADDVVEISCRVGSDGITPIPVSNVPAAEEALVRSVKAYERLCLQAIRERSISTAVEALMTHPLVVTYPHAKSLVDGYLEASRQYVGNWSA